MEVHIGAAFSLISEFTLEFWDCIYTAGLMTPPPHSGESIRVLGSVDVMVKNDWQQANSHY